MKKIAFMAAICAAATLASCGNGDKLKEAQNENTELKGDLQETLATQDSLFMLLNDISDGMSQIKDLEKIVNTPSDLSGESQSRKDQIKNDMMAIQQALQQRRERLEQLEAKLKNEGNTNATLQKTIQNLKNQIAEQQTEISTLTNKLAEANIKIEELGKTVTTLNTAVDSLNTGLSNEKTQRAAAETAAQEATNELNTVYYAIGTKKELKRNNIWDWSNAKKANNSNMSYFTRADRRSFTTLPLHSKKAEVRSGQPTDSYVIDTDANGQKILRITNPTKFWQRSNYLIIKVD